MNEKMNDNDELYIYKIIWKTHQKRLFLGRAKNDDNFKNAVLEVEEELALADNWEQALKNVIKIFTKHGFYQAPH